jgi:hypothetical protein
MPTSIPIKAAQAFAIANDCEQVIIFAYDGQNTHVVTWGDTVEHSAQAAAGANKIKASWNWPAEFQAESAKVLELERRLEIAETEIARLSSLKQLDPFVIHVVEKIEISGGHQTIDGYVAFLQHSSAEVYIENYERECTENHAQVFGDSVVANVVYIKHKYIGSRECSKAFYSSMQRSGTRHFTSLSDLSK